MIANLEVKPWVDSFGADFCSPEWNFFANVWLTCTAATDQPNTGNKIKHLSFRIILLSFRTDISKVLKIKLLQVNHSTVYEDAEKAVADQSFSNECNS